MYYDRTDLSEWNYLAISNDRKKSMIYHYYQLSNHVLKFQDNVCSSCHDLTMLKVNISNIAVITVKNVDFTVLFITLANLKQFI